MSRVFLDRCEVALSEADLRHALMLWVERCTMAGRNEYSIERFTLHPGNKFVVRMVVKPPEAAAKIKESASEKVDAHEPKPAI